MAVEPLAARHERREAHPDVQGDPGLLGQHGHRAELGDHVEHPLEAAPAPTVRSWRSAGGERARRAAPSRGGSGCGWQRRWSEDALRHERLIDVGHADQYRRAEEQDVPDHERPRTSTRDRDRPGTPSPEARPVHPPGTPPGATPRAACNPDAEGNPPAFGDALGRPTSNKAPTALVGYRGNGTTRRQGVDSHGRARQRSPSPTRAMCRASGGATGWLNSEPLTAADLRGHVVLVDFWTFTCINWIRTAPYLRAWDAKYRDHGLDRDRRPHT